MPGQRIFRVFISSTFDDFIAERNALQERAFKPLRALCQQHGYDFYAVDLRWGVGEEASRNQRTMSICREEIRRCIATTPRPNFVILLGDRYGWRPLPEQIPATDRDGVRQQIQSPADLALFDHWYREDRNARPAAYRLRSRTKDDDQAWEQTEARLRHVLLARSPRINGNTADVPPALTSAVEQELRCALDENPEAARSVFCFLRGVGNLPPEASPYAEVDPDCRAHLKLLKEQLVPARLPPENVFTYRPEWTNGGITTRHLATLCDDVLDSLRKAIEEEIERLRLVDERATESQSHREFAAELDASARVSGHTGTLARIGEHLAARNPSPLVIHGAPGCGKSTVMAKAVRQATASIQGIVLGRFVGATAESLAPSTLLEGLCDELARAQGETLPAFRDYESLVEDFRNRLGRARRDTPIVLLVDAVDELIASDLKNPLGWLPDGPREGVLLVLSASARDTLDAIRARYRDAEWSEIPRMSRSDGESILSDWLDRFHRDLQSNQRAAVLDALGRSGSPLHLRMMFEDALS